MSPLVRDGSRATLEVEGIVLLPRVRDTKPPRAVTAPRSLDTSVHQGRRAGLRTRSFGQALSASGGSDMSGGAWAMTVTLVLAFGALLFVLFSMVRSMRNEHERGSKVWKEFGLGIVLLLLFL